MSLNNPINYKIIDLSTSADNVVTTQPCDFIHIRVLEQLSSQEVDVEAGTGGDVVCTIPALAERGVTCAGEGIRLPALTLAGNILSTGTVLVAYRIVSL